MSSAPAVGNLRDRRDDPVRLDLRSFDLVRAELAGPDEQRLHAVLVRADDVVLEVVADDPREAGLGVDGLERGREVRGARLAEDGGLDVRGVFEARHERAASSRAPSAVCHQRFLCRQKSCAPASSSWKARFRLRYERCGPSPHLVGASEQDCVDVHPDELQPVEVVEDARHRQSEDPLAVEDAARHGTRVCSSSSETSIPIERSCSPIWHVSASWSS